MKVDTTVSEKLLRSNTKSTINIANILKLDKCYFNVADQRSNNADPTSKIKQNPKSNFQRYTTLIQNLAYEK